MWKELPVLLNASFQNFLTFAQFSYNFNITAVCVSEGENVALKLQVR